MASASPEAMCCPSLIEGLPDLELSLACGPHETCQLVLPKLIAGSFPGDRSEPEHTAKVQKLIAAGVDTFLCLQERAELKRFTPYMQIARLAHEASHRKSEVEFFHCPIPDLGVTADEELLKAIRTVVAKLLEGRAVYIHCWGGHGRTGTVICAFLVLCYGLSPEQAQDFYNVGEKRRKSRAGVWPHSSTQREQVERLSKYGTTGVPDGTILPPLEDWTIRPRELGGAGCCGWAG
ncbi:unnamed protein product [Durusdinium trenchii]|uniref:Tyrosine phosphatase 067L n=2 Tax=Durusdinium trenchii TaxID=1381693 RepID=A0ABP0QIC9_9DINO